MSFRLPIGILSSLILLISEFVAAQQLPSCEPPPAGSQINSWPQGSTVKVNISPDFNNLTPAVRLAVDNWAAAASSNGSGVTFVVTTLAEPPVETGTLNITYRLLSRSPTGDLIRGLALMSPPSSCPTCQMEKARIDINNQVTDPNAISQLVAQEIGHTFGLDDCYTCSANSSVMRPSFPPTGDPPNWQAWFNQTAGRPGPCSEDNRVLREAFYPASLCEPPAFGCGSWDYDLCACLDPRSDEGLCYAPQGCSYFDYGSCRCRRWDTSPIVLAVGRSSLYRLVGPSQGVTFDITGAGQPLKMGWTAAGAPVAFLALDRNANGRIDNGLELFGNFTPIPGGGTTVNGFEALAVFDALGQGGDSDGYITPKDGIWQSLLLWIDSNHDGHSQPDELFRMEDFGVQSISLSVQRIRKRDRYGNSYRYRAEFLIRGENRAAYDVFFAVKSSSGSHSSNSCQNRVEESLTVRHRSDLLNALIQ